jgi:transcriptional regulator with AAA-type ATPase domain
MPHLHFFQGETPLFVHLLRPGRTVLGRSDRCDVALPSEDVSRVHCLVEQRADGWWLTDRSRNGTQVNGEDVERRQLQDGDVLGIGDYAARFALVGDRGVESPTATAPRTAASHEELVEVSPDGVAASRAQLRFTTGPLDGRLVVLKQARTTVGGAGADIVLGGDLPSVVARIRVVRGRVMVEPGEGAILLAGVRLRQITPIYSGEELRVGDHGFTVEVEIEEELEEADQFGQMVGREPVMRRLFGVLVRIAGHDDPALLTGETGTGKELAARGLHDSGPRRDGPFVALNCASIAETLFESELFGHEKGSFTGATRRQDGAFQRAHGGTLLLDEIGEMGLDEQAKLLRALESGEVRRVGSGPPEFPDVRVIAATNRDLATLVHEKQFRGDLYFRLAVLAVRLPPLRDRRGDIGLLAQTLLDRVHPGARLTPAAVGALEEYDWPGNVRELRNVLTRAFVLGGPHITAGNLSFHPWAFDGELPMRQSEDHPERRSIVQALHQHGGNRTRAARALGIPRSSLLYKMKKWDVQ